MEKLNEQLSVKTAREQSLAQENQRLRRQLEMLLRIGPTRHRELMSAGDAGCRGLPKHILPALPGQHRCHNDNQNTRSIQMRSYSSFALRRFGRLSDSPPKLLPSACLRRRPASAAGHFSLRWNGVEGDEDISSPDENEDEEDIVEDSSSGDEIENEEDRVASTTSGIHEDYQPNRINDVKGRKYKRGRPRKIQSWPAHYATHPMLQMSSKNLSKRPRPSPPPEVTSSEDTDTPSRRKKKKPLQEIVDSQAKSSVSK